METENKSEPTQQEAKSYSQTRWVRWLILPVVIFALSAGAIFYLYPAASQAAGIPGAGGWFGSWGNRGERDGGRAYLAEALGVSEDDLDAAQDEARVLQLQARVEAGELTQEEADQILAQRALADYLHERLPALLEQTIQQAVSDGIVTQEQADQILSGEWQGLRGLDNEFGRRAGGPRGQRGHRGPGALFGPHGGDGSAPPATDAGEGGS